MQQNSTSQILYQFCIILSALFLMSFTSSVKTGLLMTWGILAYSWDILASHTRTSEFAGNSVVLLCEMLLTAKVEMFSCDVMRREMMWLFAKTWH